jgi:hypothetical protein
MPDARWNDPREYDDLDRGDGRPRVYGERDRDDHDPRDSLIHHLDLPHGEERELVVDRDRVYELNDEDSRTLAAVGTFRVVPEQHLDTEHETLRHLRDEGLVETVDLGVDLRHTTATLLLTQGVHPRVVMETLGHSQVSLTLDTYSHVLPSLQAEAARRMEDTIGCQIGCQEQNGAPPGVQEDANSLEFVVTRIFTSWNQMVPFVRRVEQLRAAI